MFCGDGVPRITAYKADNSYSDNAAGVFYVHIPAH